MSILELRALSSQDSSCSGQLTCGVGRGAVPLQTDLGLYDKTADLYTKEK